jgi:DNA-binding NtrC family response regulator
MLPRILVIDDLFGRDVTRGRNTARENLCAHFHLRDVTGDAACTASEQVVLNPQAEAVFHRGQLPIAARVGDSIENDLSGTLAAVMWRNNQRSEMRPPEAPPWAMVLVDLCFYTGAVTEESDNKTSGMPPGSPGDDDPESYFGLTLLDAIHGVQPDLPILILSSKPRDEVSLEFAKKGALGFIPRNDPKGHETLREALWIHGLLSDPSGEIVGSSLRLLLALRDARRASRTLGHLLIRGERGTGKELLARYVNRMSAQEGAANKRPFVPVNSAAFAQNLFASELFGIRPKTASGVDGKTGLIERANGGDLFMDEIVDMPAETQAAMLRVLQEGQILPVGAREPEQINVRFLSATNADVENINGGFRPDLLDRLRMGGTLSLPPLRERSTDIPQLVEEIVREAEARQKAALHRSVTVEAIALLQSYEWPGNIRELRSVLIAAVSRFPGVEHLVPSHLEFNRPKDTAELSNPSWTSKQRKNERIRLDESDDILALIKLIERVDFESTNVPQWANKLHSLNLSWQRLLARYLAAAIAVTKRRTASVPQGEIQIHPAVKLITGNQQITATKAADLVKKILKPLKGELEGDLLEAFTIAERLRPRSAVRNDREHDQPRGA